MIRVGIAGWSYDDWRGIVYPERPQQRFDQLAFLADYFDTIEINSSFYRPPTAQMARSWARRVAHNPGFKFTAKLWQRFTHEADGFTEADIGVFKKGIDPLAESGRLGALLMQFPWSFKNLDEGRKRLERLIESFREYPLVLEVRHGSWDRPEVLQFLRQNGVGFCNIDQPIFGKSIKPGSVVTASVGYFRMHGRNYQNWFREEAQTHERYDYLYAPEELDELLPLMRQIAEQAQDTYIITNNHYQGKGVVNALQIKAKLTGEKPKIPSQLFTAYPQLRTLA